MAVFNWTQALGYRFLDNGRSIRPLPQNGGGIKTLLGRVEATDITMEMASTCRDDRTSSSRTDS